MAIEVELKAWLDDIRATEALVKNFASFGGSYVKEDIYYRSPEGGTPGKSTVQFRLRHEADSWVCTHKEKTIEAGIEVNNEQEFTVSDPEAFKTLISRIGCTEVVRKKKTGCFYRFDGASIELSHLEGLGDFIEIEYLADSKAEIETARQTIIAILEKCGVDESRIEARTYTGMLLEKQ